VARVQRFACRVAKATRLGSWLALGLGLGLARDASAQDLMGPSTSVDASWQSVDHGGSAVALAPNHELGGIVAFGSPPIRGGTNPFGVGFGARLGFVLSSLSFGASFVAFQGGTDVDTSEHALQVGGDLGYNARTRLSPDVWLTVRPQLGVGAVMVTRVDPPASNLVGSSTTTASLPPRVTIPDVITQATRTSSSSSSGSTSSGSRSSSSTSSGSTSSGSTSSSNSVTVSNLYLQPGVTAILSAGTFFLGVNGNVLVLPGFGYDGNQTTWLSYGAQGELGLCW
jgi:hypothetical protein